MAAIALIRGVREWQLPLQHVIHLFNPTDSNGSGLRVREVEKRPPARRDPPREIPTAALARRAAFRASACRLAQRLLDAGECDYAR